MKYTLKAILMPTALSFPVAFGADIFEGRKSIAPSSTIEINRLVNDFWYNYLYTYAYWEIRINAEKLTPLGVKEKLIENASQVSKCYKYRLMAACAY